MHILLISRGTPSANDPQWGSFEFDQAKALTALGHKVIVASVDTRFRLFWRKVGLTIEEKDGIKIYNLFVCPAAIVGLFGSYVLERYLRWLWHRLAHAIMQNEDKIDIIYPHYLVNSHKAVRYLQDFHAPIVAIEHWSEINKPVLLPAIRKMGDETYPYVNQLLTVSEAAKKAIKKHFGLDAIVVNNMVGKEFYYSALTDSHNQVKYIATGSLIRRKGFDLLVEACKQAQLPKDKWDLNIIGAGKEYNNLHKQILAAHLENNIHLLGRRTANEIIELLNQSDVFVLPSRMETFGVVYIEAMACGLPVIATPCGGPEEFVNKENGLLVPINDVDALTNAISYMYNHHHDFDKKAIADDCKAKFSSEIIATQLTGIFEEVVNK